MTALRPDTAVVGKVPGSLGAVRLLCLMPSIPLGGMERAVIRLVEHLLARGAEAHFALDRNWGIPVQEQVELIGATWTGTTFVGKLGMPQTLLEARLALRSFFRTSSDFARVASDYRPRQVLATNLNNAWFGRRIARSPSVQSVFRLPNPPGISRLSAKRSLDVRIWRSVYHSYDSLVCNSRYTASRLAETVGDDSKIHVIRNFPPHKKRREESDAPRLDAARHNVVYLGQLSRAKGLRVLVDAALTIAARRADTDFIIAGPDPWKDPFADQVKERVRASGMAERVRFIGRIEDVHGLLSQAALHICPSIGTNDSFPNVVIEAKQAGVPSIVFPSAGLPEAVENGVDGIVTADCRAETLAVAIEHVLDHDLLRSRLAAGATRSLAAYAESEITDAWWNLLEGRS